MTPRSAILRTASPPARRGKKFPKDWVCPLCGVGKDQFSEEE